MVLVKYQAGSTVIHQGALPGPRDCMYLLASGSVDIVITGGGNQGAKNEVRVVNFNHISSSPRAFYENFGLSRANAEATPGT